MEAQSLSHYRQLKTALEKLPKSIYLDVEDVRPPAVTPHVFAINTNEGQVTINGYVPSESALAEMRKGIAERFPDRKIVDNSRLGSGATKGWRGVFNLLTEQLARLITGSAAITDNELVISGQAEDQTTADGVVEALQSGLPENFSLIEDVTAREKPIPHVGRYSWSAVSDGRDLELHGNLPNEDMRGQVLRQARTVWKTGQVRDEMTVATGDVPPARWQNGIEYGLNLMKWLKSGRVQLENTDLSVSGTARDRRSYTDLRKTLRSPPKDYILLSDDITPPLAVPHTWTITSSGERVTVAGHVPDEDAYEKMMQQVQGRWPDVRVDDASEFASGAAPGWAQAVELVISQIGRMTKGNASIVDNRLIVEGETTDPAIAQEIKTLLNRRLPQGFRVTSNITWKQKPVAVPRVSPHIWVAEKSKDGIELSGFVPGEDARNTILRRVNAGQLGRQINDRMNLGQGKIKPKSWERIAGFGLEQLARMETGIVRLSDGDMWISGTAGTIEDYEKLLAAFNRLPKGLAVKQREIFPPKIDAYAWRSDYHANSLTLSGNVPDPAFRRKVLSAARNYFPGAAIVDRMEYGSGAPDEWQGAVLTSLAELSRLDRGNVVLWRNELDLQGWALTEKISDSIQVNLRDKLTPNYTFRTNIRVVVEQPDVARLNEEDGIEAQGSKFDEEEENGSVQKKRGFFSRLKDRLLKGKDRVAVDSDGPGADVAMRYGIGASDDTEAHIDFTTRNTTGGQSTDEYPLPNRDAKSGAEERRTRTAVRVVPKQVLEQALRERKRVQADQCEILLNSIVAYDVINFDVASAALRKDSLPTLQRITDVAQRCPDTQIRISGHTDSDGSEKFNQYLSLRRARSVIKYLSENGVDRQRLDAVGFGEARPVVPNTSPQNKARNRRIEFAVIP